MADNLRLSAAETPGELLGTHEFSNVHYQVTKLAYGATGLAPTIITAAAPMPVNVTSATIDVMLGTDFSAVLGTSSLVATAGAAALGIGLQVIGTDGTNARILSTDTTGVLNTYDAPRTAGGLSIYRSLDVDETAALAVKAGPGQVYGWKIHNEAAANRYLRFYNIAAGSVVIGTSAITMTIPLRPDTIYTDYFPHGLPFATAISIAATTGLADNDTGAPDANDVQVNIFFK